MSNSQNFTFNRIFCVSSILIYLTSLNEQNIKLPITIKQTKIKQTYNLPLCTIGKEIEFTLQLKRL